MKGYASLGNNQHGWIDKEKPVAGPMDAILHPIVVAPCTSDVHAVHDGIFVNTILGHETVAEVVEVGSLVQKFKPGDVVVVPCTTPNWEDVELQRKNSNNAHSTGYMSSFKFLVQRDGVFAELFLVNNADANLALKPEDVSIEAALMACDMMSTGMYGAELADIQLGDSVVVFGIGPVGLMAVAGARLKGAGRIIAIGSRPNCVKLAKEYGATDIINYKEGNIVEQVLNLENKKVDNVILAGGNASSINDALQIVKNNGSVANVNFIDTSEIFHVPASIYSYGICDINMKGGYCPGGALRMEKMLDLIRYGRIAPEKMLNYKFEGFDKIRDAYIVMEKKPSDLIKPIVYIK